MAEPQVRASTNSGDWMGQASSIGREVRAVGAAALQLNLSCVVQGELAIRPGLRPVFFDAEALAVPHQSGDPVLEHDNPQDGPSGPSETASGPSGGSGGDQGEVDPTDHSN